LHTLCTPEPADCLTDANGSVEQHVDRDHATEAVTADGRQAR
jgi:hypothetical protein